MQWLQTATQMQEATAASAAAAASAAPASAAAAAAPSAATAAVEDASTVALGVAPTIPGVASTVDAVIEADEGVATEQVPPLPRWVSRPAPAPAPAVASTEDAAPGNAGSIWATIEDAIVNALLAGFRELNMEVVDHHLQVYIAFFAHRSGRCMRSSIWPCIATHTC